MSGDLTALSAVEVVQKIVAGELTSTAVVGACLDKIDETDGALKAWAHLDRDWALAQAAEADRLRKEGRATGRLHGVPVGLKDVVDTKDLPTERGSVIFAGRRPGADAALVDRLREAGAVVLGKTKTTEFAFVHPTDTVNPHDHRRTPGGSSSGSAAAVAAGQVPVAIGTQTNGSVIRPASFCGVYGFKPSRGMISRRGVLQTSRSLDQMGGFARSLEDVAALADAIAGYDPADPASFPRPRPSALAGAREEPPVEPALAWLDMPYHDRLDADARAGMEAVVDALGPRVKRMEAAPTLSGLVEVQATLHHYEICQHLGAVFDGHWDRVSDTLKPVITHGRAISEAEYQDALAVQASADGFFAEFFTEFDAIIAPSATGEAPMLGGNTGDPVFCTIWTLAGLPAVTVPLLVGDNGLPIGLQLIGAREEDDRLMRSTAWVTRALQASLAEEGA
ncbi:MAG: amidase [Pseudomonadota bacterium]